MAQPSSLTARIEADHRRINQTLTVFAAEAARSDTPADFAEWKLDLLAKLRDFHNDLLKHFDLEEAAGGLAEELLRIAPQRANEIKRTMADHRRIATLLANLIADLKRTEQATAGRITRLRERIQVLLDVIKAHETAEGALLQEAYFQDYGAGD
jgi:hypothetical protein